MSQRTKKRTRTKKLLKIVELTAAKVEVLNHRLGLLEAFLHEDMVESGAKENEEQDDRDEDGYSDREANAAVESDLRQQLIESKEEHRRLLRANETLETGHSLLKQEVGKLKGDLTYCRGQLEQVQRQAQKERNAIGRAFPGRPDRRLMVWFEGGQWFAFYSNAPTDPARTGQADQIQKAVAHALEAATRGIPTGAAPAPHGDKGSTLDAPSSTESTTGGGGCVGHA